MIKRLQNGQYKVTTQKEAVEALNAMRSLRDEITELMQEHGIAEMQEDATELKKAATAWAANSGVNKIQLGGKVYALLRRDKYGGQWIATDDDFTDDIPPNVVPLLRVLRSKIKNKQARSEIWNRVTKRRVDPDALQRVIDEGVLTTEDVAPCYTEKDKAPFLMIYGE